MEPHKFKMGHVTYHVPFSDGLQSLCWE